MNTITIPAHVIYFGKNLIDVSKIYMIGDVYIENEFSSKVTFELWFIGSNEKILLYIDSPDEFIEIDGSNKRLIPKEPIAEDADFKHISTYKVEDWAYKMKQDLINILEKTTSTHEYN